DLLNKLSIKEISGDNLLEFQDSSGNILGFVDRDGIWSFSSISKDSLTGVNPLNPYGVTTSRQVVLPKMDYFRVDMYGALPTDGSGNITTDVVLILRDRN